MTCCLDFVIRLTDTLLMYSNAVYSKICSRLNRIEVKKYSDPINSPDYPVMYS